MLPACPHARRRSGPTPRTTLLLLALAALTALPGPVLLRGDPGSPADRSTGPATPGAPPSGVLEVAPAYAPAAGVRPLGPVPAATPLQVDVAIGPTDLAGLAAAARAATTPGSPSYRQFLTPGEIARSYGAPPAHARAVASYFASDGLAVTETSDGFFLEVTGPAGRVAQAFSTHFERYGDGGRSFFAHDTPATLPASLGVEGVLGLGDATPIRPAAVPAPSVVRASSGSCSVGGVLPPCAIWKAYNESPLLARGTNGSGTTFGIVDGYDSSESQWALQRDFDRFTSSFNLSSAGLTFAYPVAAGNTLNTSSPDQWADEEALDVEWARAAAPGDSIVMALAAPTNAALYGSVDWMVTQDRVNVLSLSWGEPDVGVYNAASMPCTVECNASTDGSYGLLHPVLVAAAAEGIGVFSASGDCGAADGTSGVSTNYPASDPWVVGVGGTDLATDSSGAWVGESGWSGNVSGSVGAGCQNQGGSGGGWSPFARPWWQSGTGVPATNHLRGAPDVAADAGTGVLAYLGGNEIAVGGTSLACPLWAGLEAIADNASGGGRLGFLDPALYGVLSGASYARAFHDIRSGTNGYAAGRGWDPVTGVGTPIAVELVPLLVNSTLVLPPSTLHASIAVAPYHGAAPLTVAATANVSGGDPPYRIYDFVWGDGNATSTATPSANHTYAAAGVYPASVTVFDNASNSTVAPPIAIVAGGSVLSVGLTANATGGPTGTPIAFTVTASGTVGNVTRTLWFGDGTYAISNRTGSFVHTYAVPGSFCAVATISDRAAPPDGGTSAPVSVTIGGAPRFTCARGPPISVNFTSSVIAADLPGDLPLAWNASGGRGPLTEWLSSNDSYSTGCQCGIFRSAGPQLLTLYANDSGGNFTSKSLAVTLYPALVGSFAVSSSAGAVPFTVTFTASASGGHGANAAATVWNFGDGTGSVGASVGHTYTTAGEYVATALLSDAGGGNASEAFLIDAEPATGGGIAVTGTVSPALRVGLGAPVAFRAAASGGTGGYTYLWNLSDGSSMYGANGSEAPTSGGCAVLSACTLGINLTVVDGAGTRAVVPLALGPFFAGRWSAIERNVTFGPRAGTTPFAWTSGLAASGFPRARVGWTFGDGGAANGSSVRHLFLTPGLLEVNATVSDPGGDSLVLGQALRINGSVIQPFRAAFTPTNLTCWLPCAPLFNASATTGGEPPYSVNWSFGDGGGSSLPLVAHAFPRPGTYTVVLNATDAIGENSSARTNVTIYAPVPVGITLEVQPLEVPSGGTFTVTLAIETNCSVAGIAPGCAGVLVPLILWARVGNATGAPFEGYNLTPMATNTSRTFPVPAPVLHGYFWFAAFPTSPAFAGLAAVNRTVGPAPAPSVDLAVPALLGLGAVVGAVAAFGGWLIERGRRDRDRPRPPVEPASPSRPPTDGAGPPAA